MPNPEYIWGFGDTVYLCYCKLGLVIPPLPPSPQWWGLRRRKFLLLITLYCWKRHFREKNDIENYFYLLKSTESTKTTSQKCWTNIIWTDILGCHTTQTVSKDIWVRCWWCMKNLHINGLFFLQNPKKNYFWDVFWALSTKWDFFPKIWLIQFFTFKAF